MSMPTLLHMSIHTYYIHTVWPTKPMFFDTPPWTKIVLYIKINRFLNFRGTSCTQFIFEMHSRYHVSNLMLVQLSLFSKQQYTVKSWQKTSLKQVMSTEIQSCWVARNFPWKKREEVEDVPESRAHSFVYLLTSPSLSPGCKKFPLMKWPHGTHFSQQSQ